MGWEGRGDRGRDRGHGADLQGVHCPFCAGCGAIAKYPFLITKSWKAVQGRLKGEPTGTLRIRER